MQIRIKKAHPVVVRNRLSLRAWILLGLAGVSVLLYIAFRLSAAFSDFFNETVSRFLRAVLGSITSVLPFSLAEILLLSSPLLLFFLIWRGIRCHSDTWRHTFLWIGEILACLSLFFTIFVWNFQVGYFGTSLCSEDKLNLDRQAVSADDLYETAEWLVGEVNAVATEVEFKDKDFSVMPYSLDEMNDKLMAAYDSLCEEYDFIAQFESSVKPVLLSEAMSYTHITGVYSYFTGEANLNVNFPDYTLPFTAAHELAHQRGIAREDEANIVAFLVCIRSDDPYIRYSGYQNMFEYVGNSLYSAYADGYYEVAGELLNEVKYEMRAYNVFFEKYRDNIAHTVSSAVNDAYLKAQKTEGTRSYGLVVDLTVAYYRQLQKAE